MRWEQALEQHRLRPGIVDLWRADLTRSSIDGAKLLSEAELRRAERFHFAADRSRWTRARGILRTLLGGYLGLDPRAVEFTMGPRGKPALHTRMATSRDGEQIQFNVSHAGETALYAFAVNCSIGIDIEFAGRLTDECALAETVFGADEASRLRTLGQLEREREFLRMWVRHEAMLKCLGLGLGDRIADRDRAGLWLLDLDVGPRGVAALALGGQPLGVRTWESAS
jgi:4'-phosphopantetheinyl transferase